MRFLRTALATDWPARESRMRGLVRWLLTRVIPEANPDYALHQVREWLVEFDDEGLPGREVGLGSDGQPVLAGPDDRNYGFWLDTNMRFEDFTGTEIDASVFEAAWRRWMDGPRLRTSSA
jgi:hypothetical protein